MDGVLDYGVGELWMVTRLRVELVECGKSEGDWVSREWVLAEGEERMIVK